MLSSPSIHLPDSTNNDKVKISIYNIEFFQDIFLALCVSVNGKRDLRYEIFSHDWKETHQITPRNRTAKYLTIESKNKNFKILNEYAKLRFKRLEITLYHVAMKNEVAEKSSLISLLRRTFQLL